jgi:hypothetical protein
MALTDNIFTDVELETAITTNPALLETISGVISKKGGYVAPTPEKKVEYENNLKVLHKGEVTKGIAEKQEKFIKETYGIDKITPDEKWYKYGERVAKETVSKAKADAAELARLKGSTDLTAAERARINELEGIAKAKTIEIDTLKNEFSTKESKMQATLAIYQSIGSVDAKLKKTPDLQEAIAIVRTSVLNEMSNEAKIGADGKISFVKPDGTFYTNPDASKMNAEQVYASKMDKWIDKGIVTPGAGGNGDGPEKVIAPGQFKTQYEGNQYLQKLGLIQGTKEFSKKFNELGLGSLPIQ